MPATFDSRAILACALLGCALFTACSSAPSPKPEPAPAPKAASPLSFDAGPRPSPPDGCEWVMNELAMPGDEFLLYLAAKCKDKTTTLQYAGGARKAELRFNEKDEHPVVEIFSAEPGEGGNAALRIARDTINKPSEAAKCFVYPNKSHTADGFVVDISPAEVAKIEKAEGPGVRSACGPYGIDTGSQKFWRVFQGFAWHFDLGQDQSHIDPGSFTLATKDSQGKWTKVVHQ